MTMEELSNVQGRAWEDVDVSTQPASGLTQHADYACSTESTGENPDSHAM